MYLQRRVYTSNPTTGTKHYVYLNGASLLSVACHNRINPTSFRLAGSPPNTASVLPLSLFSLSRYICRRPGTIQAQAFPRRKGRESLLVFRFTMYPLEGHASPRTNTRTQEAIKSRNVFAWRRHVGRGESATTAVSSNGSFRARRRPPIGKELIAIIVLPILPLSVYRLAHVGLC